MMQAGREMDALVAEKIFGEAMPTTEPRAGILSSGKVWLGDFMGCAPVWRCLSYSTEIAAAWEVIEKLYELVMNVSIEYHRTPHVPKYVVTIYRFMGGSVYSESAPTAPEAICRAALRAVGVEG